MLPFGAMATEDGFDEPGVPGVTVSGPARTSRSVPFGAYFVTRSPAGEFR